MITLFIKIMFVALLLNWIEHLTADQQVGGSTSSRVTLIKNPLKSGFFSKWPLGP